MKRRVKHWLRENEMRILLIVDLLLVGATIAVLIWIVTPEEADAMEVTEIEAEPIEEEEDTETAEIELCGCWEVYEMTDEELAEEEYWDSLELLALCVEAETGNQSLLGKRLVVDVILNRVDSPDWPDTIAEVIADPYEFSTYWNGAIDAVWEASEETYQAVVMELEERSYTTIYYFSAGGYSEYGTPWMQLEDHYFSTK